MEGSSPRRKTWTCRVSRASKTKACITPTSRNAAEEEKEERAIKKVLLYDNPHRFTKKVFEESKSWELNVSQQELEEHLKNTYSDQQHGVPMPDIAGLVRPTWNQVWNLTCPNQNLLKQKSSSVKLKQLLHQAQMEFRIRSIRSVVSLQEILVDIVESSVESDVWG